MKQPFTHEEGYYNYPELNMDWRVLYKAKAKENDMVLSAEYKHLEFLPFIDVELIPGRIIPFQAVQPLNLYPNDDSDNSADFFFKITRRVIENIYTGKSVWTTNSIINHHGLYTDPRWEYNQYYGWKHQKQHYIHTGSYKAVKIGELRFGFKQRVLYSSERGFYTSLEPYLEQTINGQSVSAYHDKTSLIVDISSTVPNVRALKIIKQSQATVKWKSSFQSIPQLSLIEDPYFIINLSNLSSFSIDPISAFLIDNKDSYRLPGSSYSPIISNSTPESYLNGFCYKKGYVEIEFYTEELYRTENLLLERNDEPTWITYPDDASPSQDDPYPPKEVQLTLPTRLEHTSL